MTQGGNGMFKTVRIDNRYHTNADDLISIGTKHPRFSWSFVPDNNGSYQTKYKISVSGKDETVWNSGEVISSCSKDIICETTLEPLTEYELLISICDSEDNWHYSDIIKFRTGFFSLSDWPSKFYTCKYFNGDVNNPEPVHIRTVFDINITKEVESVILYTASTTGVYASIQGEFSNKTEKCNMYLPYINGKIVTDECFSPGQVSYQKWHAYYRAYNITDLINDGKNVFGAVFVSMAFSACIYVVYKDGTTEIADTSSVKMNGKGPFTIFTSGITEDAGKCETYLSTLEYTGWDKPGYNDTDWKPAITTDVVNALSEQRVITKPIKIISPSGITKIADNKFIVDFGENLHGNINLNISGVGPRKWIKIRYAELLKNENEINPTTTINYFCGDPDGHTDTYLTPTDFTYESSVKYTPRFSMHGFRYAEITGLSVLSPDDVTANIVYSNINKESTFNCSDELLNKLYQLSRRTQRNNLVSIPLDCPHRERNGWLGDALCVSHSECIEWDMENLYEDWFISIREEQQNDGLIRYISPFCKEQSVKDRIDIPWSTAVVEIPWRLYMETGNTKILSDNYDLICKWLEFIKTLCGADGIPHDGVRWNDHPISGYDVQMNPDYLGALYYKHCLDLASQISDVLCKKNNFKAQSDEICKNINRLFYHDGTYSLGLQSDIAHALNFDVVPGKDAPILAKKLVASLHKTNIIKAGCLGINSIIPALSKYGHNDEVLRLSKLTCDGSWGGWIVKRDATTAFEHLIPPDENDTSSFRSLSHPFLIGSLHAWFYTELAGIKPIKAGYKTFSVKPYMPDDLSFVSASIDTPNGVIYTKWQKANDRIIFELNVPFGTIAEIDVRGHQQTLSYGQHQLEF